jgi:DNA mismatch endonuclease, patch repair protein
MDRLSKKHRSWNMSRIRSKDTAPERIVRSVLHRLGFRFRLHDYDLPGRPDIVLPRYHTVILVHGCFWHRHRRCQFAYTPKTRPEFWLAKFASNVERDRRVKVALRQIGWTTIEVWECETANLMALRTRLDHAIARIRETK